MNLPIAPFRDDLIAAIQREPFLLVVGETGSGKTTQIPQFILPNFSKIAISQPRRVAAITVSSRVAEELGASVGGDTVGYKIRFSDQTGPKTRLNFMTDGILLRECREDPLLSAYDCIIIDEAHERSLETDVLLGLLKILRKKRTDLRIIVMSATLNVEKFQGFYDNCPVFKIPGRAYDVEILYQKKGKLSAMQSQYLEKTLDTVMHIHCTESAGDILAFLTGQHEIELACKQLREMEREIDYSADVTGDEAIRGMEILPIYGALDERDQRRVFEQAALGKRKVVFATNIAATSITLAGTHYVVDCGFVKQKMLDPNIGMDALLVVPISKSAADQRAGRAGRTAQGKCYRLYTSEDYDAMEDETIPEIQRTSLASTVLMLKKIGILDVINFPLIDPPDRALLISAAKELYLLEALDENGRLTEIGNKMTEFPLPPNLSRALIESTLQVNNDCHQDMAGICAMLSSEDCYAKPRDVRKLRLASDIHLRFRHPSGDHLTLLQILRSFQREKQRGENMHEWCLANFLNYRALKNAIEVDRQLCDLLRLKVAKISSRPLKSSEDLVQPQPRSLLKSLSSALYPQLAKRQFPRSVFYHYASTKRKSMLALDGQAHTNSQIESHLEDVKTNSYMLALHLHPNSALLHPEDGSNRVAIYDDVDWVIYHDIQYTSRAFMRCVSKVLLEWIPARLLERLEKPVDGDHLIGDKSGEVPSNPTPVLDEAKIISIDPDGELLLHRKKREMEARERYLERQRTKKKRRA